MTILKLIYYFIVAVSFFLSLWILIPAPKMSLISLSVGVPEISLWLFIIQGLSLIISLICLQPTLPVKVFLIFNLVGMGITLLPLVQFPILNARFQQQIEAKLGTNYLEKIPASMKAQMRTRPLIFQDLFTGITQPEVRIKRGIQFAQPDGVDLSLNVYQPLQVGVHPGIITIYGGGWQNGSPNKNEEFSLYMANQGYTVIAVDYRHAPKYRFPNQLNDVKSALDYIKEHHLELGVDLQKMAIMGRSAGGQLAVLSGYDNDAIAFKAVITYYGPINLPHAYRNLPNPDPIDTRTVLSKYLGGSPDQFPELYKQASPINHVQPNLPPTLLVYGKRDHVVQSSAGRKMMQKLTEVNNCAIFLEISWADHSFDHVFFGLSNQLALYYTERFLAYYLQ